MAKPKYRAEVEALGLNLPDQITHAIGHLFIEWATCESLFLGVLDCLIGQKDTDNAMVVWLATKNTRARLDMIKALLNARDLDPGLRGEIIAHAITFKRITETRNFYAHAYYEGHPETAEPHKVFGYRIIDGDPSITCEEKHLDKATYNEIANTIDRTRDLFDAMREALIRLNAVLPAPRTTLAPPPVGDRV